MGQIQPHHPASTQLQSGPQLPRFRPRFEDAKACTLCAKSGRKQMQHCALTEFWSLLDQPVVPREECLSGTAAEVTTHAARSPVRGRPRYRGALTIRQVDALAVEPLFICRAMPPRLPRRK